MCLRIRVTSIALTASVRDADHDLPNVLLGLEVSERGGGLLEGEYAVYYRLDLARGECAVQLLKPGVLYALTQ